MLLTPPLSNPNFGGVPVAPDRPCLALTSAWALGYSAVKFFRRIQTYLNTVADRHRQTDRRTDGRTTCNLITALWERRERGRIQGLPKFLEYRLLSQERVKLSMNFQFCTHLLSIDRNKRPLQISGKVAVG